MKRVGVILSIFLLLSQACKEKVQDTELTIDNLSTQNMKVIPENPSSKSEIELVVYDDCTYNTLSGVKRNGKTIDIKKQFNSMMKQPCVIKNDTILIGKLPQGTYTVNYKLMDIANPASPKTDRSVTFDLVVAK